MSKQRQPSPSGFTTASLVADLRRSGVRPGDLLIVHSSMKSIGRVRGGPGTVVAALQRAVGRHGTLLMPTFSYCFQKVYVPVEPYDSQSTPSKVGLVSETFRCSPGVLRSGHPTHSVAAWGKLAGKLTEGHDPGGPGHVFSPFEQAAAQGAKVLLIGCQFNALSLLHACEERAPSPYLSIFNWGHYGWTPTAVLRDPRGRTKSIVLPHVPGCSRNFGAAQELAQARGLLVEGRFGNAPVLWFDAAPALELVTEQMRRTPDFLLCPAGGCEACDQRRVIFDGSTPEAVELGRFMIDVVTRCGCRLAGSGGEARAAAMIGQRMHQIGLAEVKTLRFPIHAWQPGFSSLHVRQNDRWEDVPSAPVAHSPPTDGHVQGRVVHLESFAELDKLRQRRGTVAVLWDGYGQSHADFRRLMDAGFEALILIDRRFTHEDVVAEGVPAGWIGRFITPMISIPQPQAVRLFGRGPVDCRLTVGGRTVPGDSTVVTGQIVGSGPGVILLCGHHDTTFNSAAPDDNLSGVATMLEVARLLLQRKIAPRHTIRFCSFGAEEQLSEGARWYALESGEARNIRLVVNTDSGGSRCGTTGIYITGDERLTRWIRRETTRSELQFKLIEEISPFSDQFPFNCLGVPALWFYRQTMAIGRHYHHTVRDTLAEVSVDHLASLAQFQAALVERLASRDAWPFPARLSGSTMKGVAAARRSWLG